MITAIYARKSTDQTGVADDAKSVTRQIEHATAYATSKGWTVDPAHVYQDDGISGAEFVKRPGFLRLMTALKPKPPFQVLIMSEESRLGREQIETAFVMKQITDAGVRVFFYLEDRERTLDSALDKVMLSLTGFASEMEREKARQRTHDALWRKARAGHVAGGAVYGYRNVTVLDANGQRVHVRRAIHPEEAVIVRRIFEACAAGQGIRRTAKRLNAAGVPGPRGRSWAPTAIREMLHRELYRGRVVWNKTKWVDKGGTKVKVDRPEAEWLTVEAPECRIIEDALWAAAGARRDQTRRAYLRWTGGRLWGRPDTGLESRYLLTGLSACGVCGGSLGAKARRPGTGGLEYRCVYHATRGPAVCANHYPLPLHAADAAIIATLRQDVLTPARIERAITTALDRYAAETATPATRAGSLTAELERLDRECARLAGLLATAEALPSLVVSPVARY
jgi:DNA invertase Pin-like site-specific DNA recombinase